MPSRPAPEDRFFAPDHFSRAQRILDVGCGLEKKVSWAVGLDRVRTPAVDLVHDLDVHPWPFADSGFDVVIASHVVEHVADLSEFCREVHRVCRAGAEVRIATPHFTSPDAHADPTHRRALAFRSFEFFAAPDEAARPARRGRLDALLGLDGQVAGWYGEPRFRILERWITFRRPHRLVGLDRLAAHAPLFYEYFLGGLAPARDLLVALEVVKEAGGPGRPATEPSTR